MMRYLVPFAVAFVLGTLAYAGCGGRLLLAVCPDAGAVCDGTPPWCCPAAYRCGVPGECVGHAPQDAGLPPPNDDPWPVQGGGTYAGQGGSGGREPGAQ